MHHCLKIREDFHDIFFPVFTSVWTPYPSWDQGAYAETTLKTSCSAWLLCYTYGPFTHESREAEELNLCAQKFSPASTKMEGFLHTDNLQVAIFSRKDGKRREEAT